MLLLPLMPLSCSTPTTITDHSLQPSPLLCSQPNVSRLKALKFILSLSLSRSQLPVLVETVKLTLTNNKIN